MQKQLVLALLTTATVALATPALAQSLKGSPSSMTRQNQEAVRYGYSFLENAQAVSQFVDRGHLVKVSPNRYMELHDVSYPYARPGVKTFLDRLSSQYTAACGEKLTITSLTRPLNRQPANASAASVHPTGMAADLRIPRKSNCRSWLERTLLSLEGSGVIDVTRERNPPHYHVAVFSQSYEQYVSAQQAGGGSEYVVRRGDTLSAIANHTGVSVAQLRAANGMSGDMLQVGQKLQIPGTTPATTASTATATVASLAPASAAGEDAPAPVVSEVTHRVRRGETLWRIANRYGTSVNTLRSQNSLVSDVLQVGQMLRIQTTN